MPSIYSAKGNAALMFAGLASGRAVVRAVLAADILAMAAALLVEASDGPRIAGLWASGASTGGWVPCLVWHVIMLFAFHVALRHFPKVEQ